jgi:NNP family nitrate/nitrite transporter-like MFS transporter
VVLPITLPSFMSNDQLNLLDLEDPKIRTLHLSWFAFFLTFVVWFNHAPLLVFMKRALDLNEAQVKTLLTLNVALTIPARVVIGMLVDRLGPRRVYAGLLVSSGFVCLAFSQARTFEQLALLRFLLGFVGAGFVIGIRLVGEWFPPRQVGLAEGIYGGWGNFGASAAAMVLPTIATIIGGENGFRYALAFTGVLTLVYGVFFYARARNTPKGATYFKPKKSGGLEVTSRGDFVFLILMNLPMYGALAVLTWRLSPGNLGLLSKPLAVGIYLTLAALFALQTSQIYRVNRDMLAHGVPGHQRYQFKQVAILDLAYLVSFGSELAVVSMLPLFFLDTFKGLNPVTAALLASSFAFMNLLARPGGGWLSDRFGRRKTLSILIAGLSVGYFLLSQVTGHWPLPFAVLATISCSFFVQAAAGAVFAMVPLVKRRMTGQIAGMVGAYGNVGGVAFLTVLSLVDYSTFFMVIGASASIAFAAAQFIAEPRGHTAEINEDGTVQLLEVG